MASITKAKAAHATLTGTTADTVAITGYDRVAVINRSATEPLWVAWEGDASPVTAVAAADDVEYVAPGVGSFIELDANGTGGGKLSVVGNGNAYSVVGVSA